MKTFVVLAVSIVLMGILIIEFRGCLRLKNSPTMR